MTQSHDPSPDTDPFPDPAPEVSRPGTTATRRAVLAGAAGTAAVAALAVGLPAARTAVAGVQPGPGQDAGTDDDGAPADSAVVAHVRAGSVDQVVVSSGDREVVLTDRALVRALVEGGSAEMSSHREAPEISKDPVADSTDVYAFVSPDRPDTVTILANYIPLQDPAGGPNFFEFGDDVRYEIHISNRGDNRADISYRFDFDTTVRNPDTFLYNTGRITSLTDPAFNRPQQYSVTRVERGGRSRTLARHVPVPPCNIGFRSTPDYGALAAAAVRELPGGGRVFAGQRTDGFYVDLGSVFDLLALRPFQMAHLVPSAAAAGIDTLRNVNVHTIALQVPITELTRHGRRPKGVLDPTATIGIWTSASRRRFRFYEDDGDVQDIGRFQQVSRLANPLVNEVLIPMSRKDEWNAAPPAGDEQFLQYVRRPEVARLLPVLYPGAFPNLAALDEDRADLVAILMTGLPEGVVPGFQNYTGPKPADLLRLNVAVPPAASPNRLGVVGGDLAGFPNGRRVFDDVVTVELRAIAGLTYPLVAPGYTPDAVASQITDGTGPRSFLPTFPYLDTPAAGYDVPAA